MTAQMDIAPDPYRELLDFWAEKVAERLSGHKSAGRARWRSALYGEAPQERYLPESAFPGGPVADANKPDEELLELL